jgi:hypothetical protein
LTVTVLSAKSKSGKNCGSIEKVFALPTSFIDGYFSETTLIFDAWSGSRWLITR